MISHFSKIHIKNVTHRPSICQFARARTVSRFYYTPSEALRISQPAIVIDLTVTRLNLLWYHGVYVTPVLFDSRFFFETVTNTDIAFHVFLRKAFLTMSHTFARFCVFPFIFYLCLFPLGDKRTPLYLPCTIDNCLQNAENAVCVSASIYSKVPKTKSCLFVDI